MSIVEAVSIKFQIYVNDNGTYPNHIFLSCKDYCYYVQEMGSKVIAFERQPTYLGIPIRSTIYLNQGDIRCLNDINIEKVIHEEEFSKKFMSECE